MNRALLFALGVAAIAACGTGGKGVSLPTPVVTIIPPAPDLAPELAAFSGTWEGLWDGGLVSRLIVERIDTNSAWVVYIWDSQPSFGLQAGWGKYYAKVEPPAKIRFGSNIRFTFTMSKDQMSIQGLRETQGRADARPNTVTMKRLAQ